jgi:hypothetical protein
VLLTCVSGWEAAVLALDFFYFFKEQPGANRDHFANLCFTAKTFIIFKFLPEKGF